MQPSPSFITHKFARTASALAAMVILQYPSNPELAATTAPWPGARLNGMCVAVTGIPSEFHMPSVPATTLSLALTTLQTSILPATFRIGVNRSVGGAVPASDG